MGSFSFTNKAVLDLSDIWEYTTEAWSETQADKYYNILISCCRELASGKAKGKEYPEIEEELFGFRIGQHIIFYRKQSAAKIEIIRILHIQMDLRSRIQD